MTRLGGPGCDVVIPGAPEGELHVWTKPPKVIRIAGKAQLEVGGQCADEALIDAGQTIRWGGVSMTYNCEVPVLQEIPMAKAPAKPAAAGRAGYAPDDKAMLRVQAGLAIDLGLVPRSLVTRWQEAVLQQEFDPDGCARAVLDGAEKFALDDPRVIERSGILLRDFLMSSLQRGVRGAGRKIRTQAKSSSAFLMANVIGFLIYSGLILVVMLLVRFNYDFSFDDMFDLVLGVSEQ